MKKVYINKIIICTVLIFTLFCCDIIFAHKGKTDADGGHYNRSTGEYHYHHGYSAHQHTNGVCPYAYDNKENNDNTTSNTKEVVEDSINVSDTTKIPKNTYLLSDNECILFTFFTYVMCILIGILSCYIYKHLNDTLKSIIHILLLLSFLVLLIGIFYTPTQIFNSFKYNILSNLIQPCINIVLFILSVYCIKNNT